MSLSSVVQPLEYVPPYLGDARRRDVLCGRRRNVVNALILSLPAMALSLPLMKSNGVSAPNRLQPGPLDTNKALATVAAGCASAKPEAARPGSQAYVPPWLPCGPGHWRNCCPMKIL
ncbi:hypothetical protein BT67DRAFT_108930 [Trichocladium antarcticum]|uniref:Uncharacterized protein n=1 Tax=Trichocladium antarcticum TaxID=1450529 RepID=A0AAN6URD4_9PEZI|nr:hypothetical protein BT67DRAFT_108930 [Trichocladium antarcticum]